MVYQTKILKPPLNLKNVNFLTLLKLFLKNYLFSMKSNKNMSTSVIASCDIPEGISSLPGVGPIDLRRLFQNTGPSMLLHADISKNILHIIELPVEEEWARFIAVARNCHEQNVEITNSTEGLILRTIRPIKAYEELSVWIGSDLLSKLEFPFLKPCNIKGNQAYICHMCGNVFENPNPLKVHLSFLCKSVKSSSPRESSVEQSLATRLNQLFPLDVPKFNKDRIEVPVLYNKSEAFKKNILYMNPICHKGINAYEGKSLASSVNTEIIMHDMTFKHPVSPQSELAPSVSSNWKSVVETFSRTSPGHTCAFCGKIYSRKYGLKIHVRTHTGYKPLKCKYCFRPFSDPSNLNKHVRLHSDTDAPYRCLQCGKVLVRRRDLERHMKSRHPEAHCLKEA